ncbi:MAG: 50S ribosomal protein L2 [Christensenellaceae bacterium]|jgi:large subunit ribosomal protein L2|nr:50S ribosomal protein L2 [Christensenellaceae bacterium]
MAIKRFKPRSPGQRFKTVSTFDEITDKKKEPEKSLLCEKPKTGGRNNQGKISVRHIGGGNRQKYRIVDFKRDKVNVPAKVAFIEYDPNRSANIALLHYVDGSKSYILAPHGLKAGDKVISGESVEIKVGNAMPLKAMPLGSTIHNVEMQPGKGGQIARSASSYVTLQGRDAGYAILKMPSGETRKVPETCYATIGRIGNLDHELISQGKAGRNRHRGIRPTVRGVVMNPVDHPHGGGEGKSPIGHPAPLTPWGKKALGMKTRSRKKPSTRFIVKDRRTK